MDDQNVRVANKSVSKKKKTAGSDVGSTRGSEDRQSLPPIGRGQKRGRDNEIEKVSSKIPIPNPAIKQKDPPKTGKPGSGPHATAPRRSARIAKPTEKAVSAQHPGPPVRKPKASVQKQSSTTVMQTIAEESAETLVQPAENQPIAEQLGMESRAASATPLDQILQSSSNGTSQTSLELNTTPQPVTRKRKAAEASDKSPLRKKPSRSPRKQKDQSPSQKEPSPIVLDTLVATPAPRKRKASAKPIDEPALKKREQASGSAIAEATAQPSTELATWTEASGFSAPESFERGTPIGRPEAAVAQGSIAAIQEAKDQASKSTREERPRKAALPPTHKAPQTKLKEDVRQVKKASALPAPQVASSIVPTSGREQSHGAESFRGIDEDFWAKEAEEVKEYMNRPPMFPPSSSMDPHPERFLTSNGIDWSKTTLSNILDDSADTKVAPSSPALSAVEDRARSSAPPAVEGRASSPGLPALEHPADQATKVTEQQEPASSSSPLSDALSSPLLDHVGRSLEDSRIQNIPALATDSNTHPSNRRSCRVAGAQKAAVAGVRKSHREKGKATAPIPNNAPVKPFRILRDEELEGHLLDRAADRLRRKKMKVLGRGAHAPIETDAPEIKRHRKWQHVHRTDPGNFAKLQFYAELDKHEHPVIAGYPPEAPPEDMIEKYKIKKQILGFGPENANGDTEQEEHFQARPAVKIDVPDHLKAILVDDWENVTKNLSLLPVPAEHSVSEVLSTYFDEEKGKRRLGSAEADLLEEVVQGMKEYFESCLGKMLLYRFEREQYFQVRQAMEKGDPIYKEKTIADIYGAEHLCRLFGT